MPFRSLPFPFVVRLQRLFHTSTVRLTASTLPNHYETLQIPSNATPAEVKKSFYALSKTHHPDLNPTDPSASKRFVKISNAYTILGTPAKRQEYDRNFLPSSQTHSQSEYKTPRGSYSSSGPAGGRPASGLSKRRTHFQGPPPSFYRSGGWGDQASKRQAAQGSSSTYNPDPTSSASSSPGMGSGQYQNHTSDVPHFDWREHLRTHENHTRRQRDRRRMAGDPMAGGGLEDGPGRSTITNMFFVAGIIGIAATVPWIIVGWASGTKSKRTKNRDG